MDVALLDDVDKGTEKLAAGAQPDLVSIAEARRAWATIARIENRLAALKAALAPRLSDVEAMARVSGTSVTNVKQTIEAGKALRNSDVVRDALAGGSISMDQASEIVKAETAAPGSARDLLEIAASSSFQVLRERSRKVVLEAERHRGLADRQGEARTARHFTDDLGMRNIHLKLPPVLGEAICNRAENEARRLHTAAKREDREEPFERHLADAFARMLSGSEVNGHHTRADVTILVTHGVVKRGWSDVRQGDRCEIPGVGPVAPEVAKEIAQDAFLSGVFYDGKDLRHFKTFGRKARSEVRRALELGSPPEFDGIKCSGCGKRFRNESDHLDPRAAGGATCTSNNDWKCYQCHLVKTEQDRKAGKLTPHKPVSLRRSSERRRVANHTRRVNRAPP